jgi:putative salt-induced outer membrane protein
MNNFHPPPRVALARALSLCFVCSCALRADQIILKNGDRVTGAIVKKDGATLTVKSELFGEITMPWDKVDSVKTDTPLNVATKDGKTVQGTLALADGTVDVTTPAARQTVAVADVTAIRNADEQKAFERLENPGWDQLWTGSGTIGFSGSKGNAQTLTFTTGVNAQRITRTDKMTVYFNSIKASAFSSGKNSNTAQAARGGLSYDHNLGARFFSNVFNDYEYDKFQNLDLRFVLGGGFGFHVIKTDRTLFDVLAGADYNHSSFTTPATTQSAEAFFGNDYNRKIGKLASFNETARMFNDLTTTGNYRVNFDAGTSVKLLKWLNWNLAFSDRYLSSPAAGRKANDILYTTGLGFTFAH